MDKQNLIQISRNFMYKHYCNGITINQDNIVETEKEFKIYLDYLVPKKVIDENTEHLFYYRLPNVALIRLSKKGELLSKSSKDEFIKESIERYKEILKQRERFIIKLFADRIIRIEQVHISLTPLRKVLRRFIDEDFRMDNLNRSFPNEKEVKYIHLLQSLHYIRKEGEKLTLDNQYIKRLQQKIKDKEKLVEQLMSAIFGENFEYIIYELNNTSITPFVGILVSLCVLLLELNKNIHLSINDLFDLYKDHYSCGQDKFSFEDKIIDMKKYGLVSYENNKFISLPIELYNELITNFKLHYKQKQLA